MVILHKWPGVFWPNDKWGNGHVSRHRVSC